jgi:diphosphomevalonate decarboxylase
VFIVKKADVVQAILGERLQDAPQSITATSFAPTNIALCKYWGKRDQEINLPETSSLSISLGGKGTTTTIRVMDDVFLNEISNRETDRVLAFSSRDHSQMQLNHAARFTETSGEVVTEFSADVVTESLQRNIAEMFDGSSDVIIFNGKYIDPVSKFSQRLLIFLNLFRVKYPVRFYIEFTSNIPLAAGLASSASGFASVVLALNQLYDWQLSQELLSILARLGSGSACRSLWDGFVEWEMGSTADGMDSHGRLLPDTWPELCVGLLIVNTGEKLLSSREAMQRTKTTSSLYSLWPDKARQDLQLCKEAIAARNFSLLGKTAESNAMTMHAMMLSAWPPISYFQPETIAAMHKIWKLRQEGLEIYFTQDAGPNLKLLFLQKDAEIVRSQFTGIEVIQPFM